MEVIVCGIIVVVDEVPAPRVVDVAVSVVIDTVAGLVSTFGIYPLLARVCPDVGQEIGVAAVNPGIGDRDENGIWASPERHPGLGCLDLLQSPLVVHIDHHSGRRQGPNDVVGLGKLNLGDPTEDLYSPLHG